MERDRERTSRTSALATEDLAKTSEQRDMPKAPQYPGESTGSRSEPPPDEPAGMPAQDTATQDTATQDTAAQDTVADETAADETPQLLGPQDEEGFRARWQRIQSEFVDDPRDAVHAADELVADVMQKLAATFADHKQDLEGQWTRGEQVNTEELRTALRRYRSFFNRLLTT